MTSSTPQVVAVFGPTASGKTAVSEILAVGLGTEVVSADALQVYRGLPILTNQPESPTRLVAIRDLSHEFSVGEYAQLAHEAIDELVRANGVAVVSGGTGLYLRSALVDLALPPAAENGARARCEALYDSDPDTAYLRLGELDPAAASIVHRNDRRRVVRALELAERGASLVPTRDRLWSADTRLSTHRRRARGAARVCSSGGSASGPSRCSRAESSTKCDERSPVGCRGQLRRLSVFASSPSYRANRRSERLIARTRRYAAYQRKWMRRIEGIVMIDGDRPPKEVADEILDLVRAR